MFLRIDPCLMAFVYDGDKADTLFQLVDDGDISDGTDSELRMVDRAFGDDFFKQNRSWDDFGTIISGI